MNFYGFLANWKMLRTKNAKVNLWGIVYFEILTFKGFFKISLKSGMSF